VVGLFQDTKMAAVLHNGTVTSLMTDPNGDDDGDSTVPRWSATPLELRGLPAGVYRVAATDISGAGLAPVHDLFVVVGPAG
jgi:hypothetical protein